MLLERQEILDRLNTYVADSRRGLGRLVLVTGEAGIGKTAVVSAMAAQLPPDTTLLWGSCDAVTPPRPFAPLLDIAHRTSPDLADALKHGDQDRVFNSFLSLIRNGPGRSRCVVIEDVHWADEPTLDLLRVVGPRLRTANAVVIATYREHEVEPLHSLRVALGDLPADSLVTIQVPALSADAVGQLARGSVFEPGALFRVTGGNPFFVTEVVAAYGRGLPATVRDAVLSRVSRLSPEADRVLKVAAVLGPRADADLILRIADQTGQALEECVRGGMLVRDGDAVTFRHELARDAVRDAIPADQWRQMNLDALALLRESEAPDTGRMARHAIEANDGPSILEFAPAAARRAADLGAHREAIQLLEVALRHAAGLGAAGKAALDESLASSLVVTGDVERAESVQRRALTLWRESRDIAGESGCLVGLSMIEWLNGDGERAVETARQSLRLLDDVVPAGVPHARANAALAQRYLIVGEDSDALRHADNAMRIADRVQDDESAIHALTTKGVVVAYSADEGGWSDLESALARAKAAGLNEGVWRAFINLVEVAMDKWQFDRADRYASQATAWMADRESGLYRGILSGRIADLALRRGRWDEADRIAGELVGKPRTASQIRARSLIVLGHIAAWRASGDPWPFLDEARGLLGGREIQDLEPLMTARIQAAWLSGDDERARVEAAAAADLVARATANWTNSELCFWAWKAGVLDQPSNSTAQPFLAQMSGQFDAAASKWADLGCPLYEALALADSSQPPAMRRSLEIFQSLGARPMVARVSSALVAAGATDLPRGPRQSTLKNPFGLTDRELEILMLLGDGLRNADIANRLVLSAKTVDHHVGAVLRKLRVSDRLAARDVARQMRAKDGEPTKPI